MLQIAMLLCGRHFILRNRYMLMLTSGLWGSTGALILTDGMLGAQYFPLHLFGWLLLCESLTAVIASSGAQTARRRILIFRGGVTGAAALLILSGLSVSNLLLAIVLGFICFLSGLLDMTSAWIVRQPHWLRTLTGGLMQVAFAVFLFQPYPTHHDGTVPQFIGALMLVSAVNGIRLSRRLRHLAPGITIFDVQGGPSGSAPDTEARPPAPLARQERHALRIFIWTPEGSSEQETIRMPLVNRYIAAVDAGGVISTGHAALEMHDVYLSLYPASDIDRSPDEFLRTLRAVKENDVPGRFLRDYASEVKDWCEADRQICFHHFSETSLRAFYAEYRQCDTYNLTWRNCSSSVARALEAALDGVLDKGNGWRVFFRLFLSPELWIAAQLRKRATAMAWTPGLLLDYSRALHGIVHPVKLSWLRKKGNPSPSQMEGS